MNLGEFLHAKNIVTKSAIEEALAVQKYTRAPLGRILRDLGYLSQNDLNLWLTRFLEPTCTEASQHLRERIEKLKKSEKLRSMERQHKVIVVSLSNVLIEAVSDSFRDEFLEESEREFGQTTSLTLVSAETLDFLKNANATKDSFRRHSINLISERSDEQKLEERDPYAQLFKTCLEDAVRRGASDIHIEPRETNLLIRFRINGDLTPWKSLSQIHLHPFSCKTKSIVNLDLAKVGKPDDSRCSFNNLKVDLRANSTPTLYGDKIVLRLLLQERNFEIDKCGLPNEVVSILKECVSKQNGLILISGPTGSGKSTTLYSLINYLDSMKQNICTVENPVEYRLPGINQVDIGSKPDLTFGNTLRAMMRQDPDVILVGEIRDEETAQVCFKAAATGHLVVSTVHANSPSEVIQRLSQLGVSDLLIKTNLRFSGAQRLIQKLCPHCSLPAKNTHIQSKGGNFRMRNHEGCKECESGVIGRIPIMEYLTKDQIKQQFEHTERGSSKHQSLSNIALGFAQKGLIDVRVVTELD